MTCGHVSPQHGCESCIKNRGKVYETNLDYQLDRLYGVYKHLESWYDKELPDELADDLDLVLDSIDSILLELTDEASTDTSQRFLGFRTSTINGLGTPNHSGIKPLERRRVGRKSRNRRLGNRKRNRSV